MTKEISEIRGFPEGTDIISPAHFKDIKTKDDLREKIEWLRKKSNGKPIGVKIAAGNIEEDLEIATYATPPTDESVLTDFYKTTRPFGFWAHIREKIPTPVMDKVNKENRRDIISIFIMVL